MSEFKIKDGTGDGFTVKVDGRNRFQVKAVSLDEQQAANELGNGYNINTGTVSLSAATAILYFKNTGSVDFVLDAFAVGIGSGTFSDSVLVTLTRNPTGGTLIDTATAVDMNQNRNFGSNNTLSAALYKGASGATVTGGASIAQFFQTGQGRIFVTINFVLPAGSSIAVSVDPNLSSGSVNAYAALVGRLKDASE